MFRIRKPSWLLVTQSIKRLSSLICFVIGRSKAYKQLRSQHKTPGTTLAGKVLFKMAWDRNPLLHEFSDKMLVRDYISGKVGREFLVPLIGSWDAPEFIPWREVPKEFVLKVTHGSGGVIVVSEQAPDDSFLPSSPQGWCRFEVHPQNFDTRVAEMIISHWQTLRYEWWPGRKPEFGYRGLRPRVIMEELIKPVGVSEICDLKAYAFNGQVQFFELFVGGVAQRKQLQYLDRFGNLLPVRAIDGGGLWPALEITPALPWLDQLVEISEILAEGLDFIRVDFISSGNRFYLGELTSYPSCGEFSFEPSGYDTEFGSTWHPSYQRP